MTINIPTSLKDITMRQFIAYEKSDKTDDDCIIHLCNFQNVKLLSKKDYDELVLLLREILNSEVIFERTFKHEGISFGLIPNLEFITTNEYLHIDEFTKSADTLHKALAVLYRPITKRKRNWFRKGAHDLYDILPYKEQNAFEEMFLDVSCIYYLGAMVFFYNLGNDLLKSMQDYLVQLEIKTKKKVSSMISGDGMFQLGQSQN